ncbi:actin-domain-containing protein [Boletus reticuloceps]|uniref:Actin-domain-containing protein n=1 Tax=Boletus reticuloceps TaxID=495285 RepID=A0A8I2YU75_9AGAM|nr:actin-domain-containing protein [Boletus reticuloceps]
MVNYGGDEVSALVVDMGSSSVRAGYAGDDTPKAIVSSYYGYRPTAGDSDVQMGDTAGESNPEAPKPRSDAKLYLGQHGPSIWRAGMEIGHPFRDGLMSDFNPIPALISHALVDSANRERMAEIMFEEFQVPAFYIANTGVLNAFAAGKGSALVVDVGHSMASITPVVDGFVLRKGLVYSALPKLVHAHAKHILANPTPVRRGIELYPHQLIATKISRGLLVSLRYTRIGSPEPRIAGGHGMKTAEVDEWIQSVASVLDQGWNEQAAASRPPRQYEFPTGYNMYFGAERFQVGEQFFHHSPQLVAQNPNLPKNIPALLSESLRACDPDLRQVLMGNVVLTGGGSLFAGFADRLETELSRNIPHVKIHAPGNPMERRYGGWLGGSILASLGTFHQLWISREEWQEYGKAIVGQRCK